MGTNRPWPQQPLELLCHLWSEGLSASRIAYTINTTTLFSVTRNAVIGKLSRLGLLKTRPRNYSVANGKSTPRILRNFPSARKPSRALTAAEPSLASLSRDAPPLPFNPHEVRDTQITDRDPPEAERVTLLDLTLRQCRFPLGDPPTFCGRHTAHPAHPYCLEHMLRAYAPKSKRTARPLTITGRVA